MKASPIAQRMSRALASGANVFRFLMQPRDLEHPEACDFLAGNPQEPASADYVAILQRALEPDSRSYFAYGPPWEPAVQVAAQALGERLAISLDPADIVLTRGAASGLGVLLRLLLDPGDEVVMMSPPWFFYEPMVLAEDAVPVKVQLTETFDLDLDAIERALSPRSRIVLINTPHNPSGRLLPEDQLRGLAGLLERASARSGRRIYIVSDEAYARILFDRREMLTPARWYAATFMLHTYSKTLLAPSQRAGYLAMPPDMPGKDLLRLALMATSLSMGATPDTGMQRAIPELEPRIIDMGALERRRDRVVAEMRRFGYQVDVPEATFYLFPRCPIPDSIEFCDWLAERRVYVLPGEAFERPGFFRLSLTATDAMVDRALPVLEEAFVTLASSVAPRPDQPA
jgi:aspartate aminotransferase